MLKYIYRVKEKLFPQAPFYHFLLFLLSLVASAILGYHHEMWRDEAQKWLISRDLDLLGIINQTAYEGHPFLYYLVIYPFASLDFPYQTMQVISWVLLNLNVYILLRYSPFHFILKTAIVFSYFFAFEYGNIAINYSIVLTLIFSLAAIYPARQESRIKYAILLFLLFNSHVLVMFFAVFLSLKFTLELIKLKFDTKAALSISIMVAGFIFLYYQLQRPLDSCFQGPNFGEIGSIASQFKSNLFPFFEHLFAVSMIEISSFWSISWLLLIITLAGLSFLDVLGYLCSILWIYFVINFYYNGELRYYAFCFVFLLFFCWIYLVKHQSDEVYLPFKKIRNSILTLLLVLILIPGVYHYFKSYRSEINYSYSGAKEMATYINQHEHFMNNTIVGFRSTRASAVCAYLNKKVKFWYPEYQKLGSFVHWDSTYMKGYSITPEILLSMVKTNSLDSDRTIYLFNADYYYLTNTKNYFTKIYENQDSVFKIVDERYVLAKLK